MALDETGISTSAFAFKDQTLILQPLVKTTSSKAEGIKLVSVSSRNWT